MFKAKKINVTIKTVTFGNWTVGKGQLKSVDEDKSFQIVRYKIVRSEQSDPHTKSSS